MRELKIGRVYKHFKGDCYIVVGIGKYSETEQQCVIYKGLYGSGPVWIRPLESFLSEIDITKYPDIKQKYRFELQDIESARK